MTERRADVECSCEITFRKDPIRTNELNFSMIRNFGLDKITQEKEYRVRQYLCFFRKIQTLLKPFNTDSVPLNIGLSVGLAGVLEDRAGVSIKAFVYYPIPSDLIMCTDVT